MRTQGREDSVTVRLFDIAQAEIVLPKVTRMRLAKHQQPAMRASAWRGVGSLRRPAPVADPSSSQFRSHLPTGAPARPANEPSCPNACVIEVGSDTAGIVAKGERSYRFLFSDRIFDTLEGLEFRTARDAERAARALFLERRYLVSGQLFGSFSDQQQHGPLARLLPLRSAPFCVRSCGRPYKTRA